MSQRKLLQEGLREGRGIELEKNADSKRCFAIPPTTLPTPLAPKYHDVFKKGKVIRIMFTAPLFVVAKEWEKNQMSVN